MKMYRVTEGCIRSQREAGTGRQIELRRGEYIEHSEAARLFGGEREVQRLVSQGYFAVEGLRPGLEPGSILPRHEVLPTDAKFGEKDHAGVGDTENLYGKSKQRPEAPHPQAPVVPGPKRVERKVVTGPDGQPLAEARDVSQAGVPRGRMNLEPKHVAKMDIDQLNSLIADRLNDNRAPRFQAGEEQDARAFLTQDFGQTSTADQPRVAVEGDLDANPNPDSRIIVQK